MFLTNSPKPTPALALRAAILAFNGMSFASSKRPYKKKREKKVIKILNYQSMLKFIQRTIILVKKKNVKETKLN